MQPVQVLTLSSTEPGEQKVVGPPAVAAADGRTSTVTVIVLDIELPHELVTTQLKFPAVVAM